MVDYHEAFLLPTSMNTHDPQLLINKAFDEGQYDRGLQLLRKLNQSGNGDAGSWNRQAVVEEQIGDWAVAGRAHYQCIELAPHIAASYLYAGYWLQKSHKHDQAAASYALAAEADPSILQPPSSSASADPREIRSNAGYQLLRETLSQQHSESIEQQFDCPRVRDAIWVQTHDRPWSFPKPQFQPQLFYLPEVSIEPWYQPDSFAWANAIRSSRDLVANELKSALSSPQSKQALRPYLDSSLPAPKNMQQLVGSKDWSALDIYKDGMRNDQLAREFPITCKLLEDIPTYGLDQTPFEVFFSVLRPQQSIAPHYGQSNHSLTVHLALDIPDNCYLEVAGQRKSWAENQLLIFDDSFLHSAHNNSQRERVVLIFSIWHPDLSDDERQAVQVSFETRRQWMLTRREKLNALITD